MNQPTNSSIGTAFSKLLTLVTALGSQLPGISFFVGITPPDFRGIALLTSGGTIAIFIWVFNKPRNQSRDVKRGVKFIATAILLAAIYGVLFQFLTVGTPAARVGHQRFQIGFGMCSFSLRDTARKVASEQHLGTPEELMLAFGGYEKGTSQIWKTWSIIAAAAILWVVFMATYVFWTSGLAYLARSLK